MVKQVHRWFSRCSPKLIEGRGSIPPPASIINILSMNNNKTNIFLKGISVQTLVTVALGIIELGYFAIMSRLLTKQDFGYFAAISGIMAIITSLSEAGLGSSIIQKNNSNDKFVSTAYTLSLCLGLLFTFILFAFSPYIADLIADRTLSLPLRIMSITILLNCLNSCGNALLYKKLKFSRIGINSIISYLISSLVGILMALRGFGLYSVIAYSVTMSLVTFILVFISNRGLPAIYIHKADVKGIISYGGWLSLSTLANNIMHQVDKLVLPKWMSVTLLGAYNRPAGFINTISSKINSIFDTVLFPLLSEIQNKRDKVGAIFLRAVDLLNSFSVVLSVFFIFNSRLLINVFFGEEWMDLVPVFQILSFSLIFNIDNRLVDCFFRSLNLVKVGFYIRCFGLLLMLASIYAGSHLGIIGVAIAVVLANILTIIFKMVVLCIKIDASITNMVSTWVCSLKSSIPLILPGALYLLLPYTIPTAIIFAIIFCLILIFELLFFPRFVSAEYYSTIYPKLSKVINKIK